MTKEDTELTEGTEMVDGLGVTGEGIDVVGDGTIAFPEHARSRVSGGHGSGETK